MTTPVTIPTPTPEVGALDFTALDDQMAIEANTGQPPGGFDEVERLAAEGFLGYALTGGQRDRLAELRSEGVGFVESVGMLRQEFFETQQLRSQRDKLAQQQQTPAFLSNLPWAGATNQVLGLMQNLKNMITGGGAPSPTLTPDEMDQLLDLFEAEDIKRDVREQPARVGRTGPQVLPISTLGSKAFDLSKAERQAQDQSGMAQAYQERWGSGFTQTTQAVLPGAPGRAGETQPYGTWSKRLLGLGPSKGTDLILGDIKRAFLPKGLWGTSLDKETSKEFKARELSNREIRKENEAIAQANTERMAQGLDPFPFKTEIPSPYAIPPATDILSSVGRSVLGELTLGQSLPERREATPLSAAIVAASVLPFGTIASPMLRIFSGLRAVSAVAPIAVAQPRGMWIILKHVDEALLARKRITPLVTAERAKRFREAAEIFESVPGEAGALAGRRVLKGVLPTEEMPAIRDLLTKSDVDELYQGIIAAGRPGRVHQLSTTDIISAQKGLAKLLDGRGLPAPAELDNLIVVFGREFVEPIRRLAGTSKKGERALNLALSIVNFPRALQASYDMSAPLRQGIVLGAANPPGFVMAMKEMFKTLKVDGELYAQQSIRRMKRDPLWGPSQDVGLEITERAGKPGVRVELAEEAYMSGFISLIPGLRISERAYVTFMNELRFNTFARHYDEMLKAGATTAHLKELAQFINWASGRGPMPFRTVAGMLNAIFFAPRFVTSRIALPLTLLSRSPTVRKLAARSMIAFVSSNVALLSMLKLSGAADVELNPRSTDFGRIRIGPVRIDFWAGFQPLARTIAQLITAERKTTGTGEIVGIDRDEVITRWIISKFSPGAQAINERVSGETFAGAPVTLRGQAYDRLTPLFIQDLRETIQEMGLFAGAFMAVPGFFGASVLAYRSLGDAKEEASQTLFNKPYRETDQGERDQINDTYQVSSLIDAFREFGGLQTREEARFARQLYWQATDAASVVMRQKLDTGIAGQALRAAIRDYRSDSWQRWQDFNRDEVNQILAGDEDPASMRDSYAVAYWSVPAPPDAQTGFPDLFERDLDRQEILHQAGLFGVDIEYITGRGAGTFQGKPRGDPVVVAAILQYDIDHDKMRDFLEAPRRLAGDNRELYNQYQDLQQRVGEDRKRFLRNHPPVKRLVDRVKDTRERLRTRGSPEMELLLHKWGYITLFRHSANKGLNR